jgi:F-type H+-transporting ATPase subunit gamma
MPSLKALRTRIASVKSTRQITKAMKLVAAAKMKRAIESALAARPYSDEVTAVMQSLMARVLDSGHPLLAAHAQVQKVAVVVITSDRGLCGGFNNQLLRRTDTFLWDGRRTGAPGFADAELILFGKKGRDFFLRRGGKVGRAVTDLRAKDYPDATAKLVHELTSRYEAGELDEVYLSYNRFVNTLKQEPTIEKLFPLTQLAQTAKEPEHLVDFVYEPSQGAILRDVLPLFLRTRITQVFLESEAGEHAARMTAMDSATRNASDVIDALTLQYNRARQAAITKELVEIVAGAEAL